MKIRKSTGALMACVGCLLVATCLFCNWAAGKAVESGLIPSYNRGQVILGLILSLALVFAGIMVIWKGGEA